MSNTTTYSDNGYRDLYVSDKKLRLNDLEREHQELIGNLSEFNPNLRYIDEETTEKLNRSLQVFSQRLFIKNGIKEIHSKSQEPNVDSYKNILPRRPVLYPREEDDSEDDETYENKKITETQLDSDDEELEEEYNSEFDDEDDTRIRHEERRQELIDNFKFTLETLKSWSILIVNSQLFIWIARIIGFAIVILVMGTILWGNTTRKQINERKYYSSQYIPVDSLTDVNSRFMNLQNQLDEMNSRQYKLELSNGKVLETLQQKQHNLNQNWDQLNRKYSFLQNHITDDLVDRESMNKELTTINNIMKNQEEQLKRVKTVDIDHSKHLSDLFQQVTHFESNMDSINHKLEDLISFKDRFEGVFTTLENDVLQSIIAKLPSMIPIISTGEGKIQMFPEVYDYLSDVIRNTVSNQLNSIDLKNIKLETDMSWDNFMKQNGVQLNQYLTEFTSNDLKLVKKLDFEHILVENFKANRDKLDKELLKIKKSIDQNINVLESKISRLLHVSSDELESTSTSELLIEHLIDKKLDENLLRFEGKLNYASLEQGLNVIRKLTSTSGRDKLRRRKSILGRMLFGWYDALKRIATSGQSASPGRIAGYPKNFLVNDNSFWVSLVDDCHIGINLAKSIILTDVIIKHPRSEDALVLTSAPRKISLYIEPTSSRDQALLKKKFSSEYDQDFSISELKHFTKITEFEYDINNRHVFQFIPIPKEYLKLNMKISKIYLDVESNWGHEKLITLHNIKVFGVNDQDIENARAFLKLDQDTSTEEVLEKIREEYVSKATYTVDENLNFADSDEYELGVEF